MTSTDDQTVPLTNLRRHTSMWYSFITSKTYTSRLHPAHDSLLMLMSSWQMLLPCIPSKTHCTLIGFTDFGEVNEHLLRFKLQINATSAMMDDKPLAKSMTFIVWRVFTSLQTPYAQFPCASISVCCFWALLRSSAPSGKMWLQSKCGYFVIACLCFDTGTYEILPPKFRILMKPQSTGSS